MFQVVRRMEDGQYVTVARYRHEESARVCLARKQNLYPDRRYGIVWPENFLGRDRTDLIGRSLANPVAGHNSEWV